MILLKERVVFKLRQVSYDYNFCVFLSTIKKCYQHLCFKLNVFIDSRIFSFVTFHLFGQG